MFYTYIIKSLKTNKYYVGSTKNLDNRINDHNKGLSKYTKREAPWSLIYKEEFENLSNARKRELQIKSWKKRSRIEQLIIRSGPIV